MNTITDKEVGIAALHDGGVLPEELAALGGEIVELIYTLVASPGANTDESAISRAFSELLLRHWEICCITVFLRDEGNGRHLRECFLHTDDHIDASEAKRAAALLADALEREGREQQVWLDDDETDAGDAASSPFAPVSPCLRVQNPLTPSPSNLQRQQLVERLGGG